jgi:hypothetical protein
MGSSANDPMPLFLRRSDTESVCTTCFQTLRIEPDQSQEIEENLHKVVCPASSENLRSH